MRVGHRNLTWTLMPLFLASIYCSSWRVDYPQQCICAVKGSSVVIPCSFHYPEHLRVKAVMWTHVKSHHFKGHFIFVKKLREVNPRLQYIGNKHHNCSLKIHQVEHNDTGIYAFRFVTNDINGKFTGEVGSNLKVVDLNILVTKSNGNKPTKEGDSVNLTCINSCDGDHRSSTFSWFKNGELINKGPELTLSNVSSTNSGNYTCSLKTHTGTTSEVINIDVEHGPKNTSVFVRPSMEVEDCSNAILICSSHGNPPVENYTWFKRNDDDDDDDDDDVGHQHVFFPGDGGQYFCRATNKHGSQNSSVVSVMIKPYLEKEHIWRIFGRIVRILSAVAVLLIAISAVFAIRRLNRKRKWASKTDGDEDIQSTDHANWLTCDNNQSQEGNQPEGGTTELVYAAIDFSKKRNTNTERRMSYSDDEEVIYSTVCRSHLMNPSCIQQQTHGALQN